MKRLMLLLQTVLRECGTQCGISTDLDWKTIERRVENEGLWFLTTVLPAFGSAVELTVAHERAVPDAWSSWTMRGKTPVFLGGFLDLIFDRESGMLHSDIWVNYLSNQQDTPPNTVADMVWHKDTPTRDMFIYSHYGPDAYDEYLTIVDRQTLAFACIRQVTKLFSKVEINSPDRCVELAYNDFVMCEKELASYVDELSVGDRLKAIIRPL